jgi:hypothetical protein
MDGGCRLQKGEEKKAEASEHGAGRFSDFQKPSTGHPRISNLSPGSNGLDFGQPLLKERRVRREEKRKRGEI